MEADTWDIGRNTRRLCRRRNAQGACREGYRDRVSYCGDQLDEVSRYSCTNQSLRILILLIQRIFLLILLFSEEGARFPISMVSSAVWGGQISLERAHTLKEVGGGGKTIKQELERIGYLGDVETSWETNPIAVGAL